MPHCRHRQNTHDSISSSIDGQTERMNRTLLQMLRTTASDNANNWPSFLPALMSAYRMTTHSVTGTTPNLAMLGREVLIPATLIAQPPDEPSKPVTPYVTTFRSTIREVHHRIRQNTGAVARVAGMRGCVSDWYCVNSGSDARYG